MTDSLGCGMINLTMQRSWNELKKALLVIDYTVDFVALDGALTCGEPGVELERYITSLTENFLMKTISSLCPLMFMI